MSYRSIKSTTRRLAALSGGLGALLFVLAAQADAPIVDLGGRNQKAPGAPTLDERVGKLERVLENQTLIDLTQRLENLQQQTTELVGQMEEVRHTLDELKTRQRELYLDVDRRLQALEAGGARAAAPSSTGDGGGAASAAPSAADVEARNAYQSALNVLRQGNYAEAIKQFQNFVTKYGSSEYADNAQYWLADANYVQQRYDVALKEFEKLIKSYPSSKKYADALLKTGLCHLELGNTTKAQIILNDIKVRYPNSPESQIADKRLQQMKSQTRR